MRQTSFIKETACHLWGLNPGFFDNPETFNIHHSLFILFPPIEINRWLPPQRYRW
ncbi:hypothetical protein BDM02DRAFT_3109679 [Thelephora ganbajun]|uniref:Uncharacterized protein n=1 Tax=Thelephora ganbajun TaxID=370292 RepID=A0ACB6ZR49_THEGA|nr:hypothetical protein BDM02DRAFT_3109679 [Thelephora ganbajun]